MAEAADRACVHHAGRDRDGTIGRLVCGGIRMRTVSRDEECGDGRDRGRRHGRTDIGIQRRECAGRHSERADERLV